MNYTFEKIDKCEMCGDDTSHHKILGQRLNKSQGYKPKRKAGLSVSVCKCTNCELIYSQPMPIPKSIQDHYGVPPETYWTEDYFTYNPAYFKREIDIVKTLLPFKEGMTALDVGAGIGKCMISLERAGFKVYGMEPSKPFYEKALSLMKINPEYLKFGMVEDVDYPYN